MGCRSGFVPQSSVTEGPTIREVAPPSQPPQGMAPTQRNAYLRIATMSAMSALSNKGSHARPSEKPDGGNLAREFPRFGFSESAPVVRVSYCSVLRMQESVVKARRKRSGTALAGQKAS